MAVNMYKTSFGAESVDGTTARRALGMAVQRIVVSQMTSVHAEN